MRKLLLAVLVLLVLLLAAVAAGSWYLRTARPLRDGAIALPGLRAPVEIWRDSLDVPHVFAASEADLLFAQGYLHAQDRLWQLELLRRAGEGRLSELFGRRTLAADRFLRTLELARIAGRDAAAADPAAGTLMDAYVAGINAWLRTRTGALPPEFVLLRARPEPWTRMHSLLVGRMMALDLSLYYHAVAVTRAAHGLDSARAAVLQPLYPEWGVTTLESAPLPLPPAAAAVLAGASIARASNAWVVDGRRTRSGRPILANDMHLSLGVPGVWYLMALHADSLAVTGMSLPGVPYIIAGHNRAVAWGFTNAMLDDADLFLERPDPADSARYLTPDGSLPFEYLTDTIAVRGRESEIFRHRRTRHGPVVSDVEAGLGGLPVALRWASQDPASPIAGVRGLNHARDWTTFRAAVAQFDDPHQNVVFADTGGAIGYALGGRIPFRGDGTRRPPTLPVPGWTGEWDWRGYLEAAAHPALLDPPRGYIVTANNRQALGALGDRIGTDWASPFRAERITQLVSHAGALTTPAVHRMQLDVRDAHAERYRDRAVAAARAAGDSAAADALAFWDLQAWTESQPAARYYAWYASLRAQLAGRLYGDTAGYVPEYVVDAALEQRALPWLSGHTARAAFDSASRAAFRAAAPFVGDRNWGDIHSVRMEHGLGGVAWLRRIFRLNLVQRRAPGSENTVNAVYARAPGLPAVGGWGVSQRHVVDLGDIDGGGGFIIATGQSGLPFDAHYRDQFEKWQHGGLWLLPLDRGLAAARTVHRLTLRPD
ncbi:MAG: penicillin acylase family protein [Gemmatimonadetes bacterium]|nr:penicillin acylase family protein [Gemmatimonadota bacterium]